MLGTVLRAQSGFFWVKLDESGEVLRCVLRGRLKKERQTGDLATIGDRVRVSRTIPGEGAIEEVEPRRTSLSRRASLRQGAMRENVIVANLDLLLATFAVVQPEPHRRMIDRFLIIAEASAVSAAVVANKLDLCSPEQARAIFADYERVGYPVFYTSTVSGQGIVELRQALQGKISAFAGPSGVGKSSLLNAIQPGLGLRVGEISASVNKGRHTTVAPELHPLDGGGYVADTPGIRELSLWRIQLEQLDWCFREFRPYLGECAFDDCSHGPEPGCAVSDALQRGLISAARYESYLRLRRQMQEEQTY